MICKESGQFCQFKDKYWSYTDPLEDLNVMHEIEKMLLLPGIPATLWERYDNLLFIICGGFAHVHATASQRAEAFLKAIGKW